MAVRWKRWVMWISIGVGAVVAGVVAFLIIWQLTHQADDPASEDFADLAEEAASATTADATAGTAGTTATNPATTTAATTSAAPATTTGAAATTAGAAPATTGGAPGSDGLGGSWTTITPTAEEADTFYVGYRVDEVLFGQNVTATGRTSEVTGSLTFEGTTLTAAEFTAQLASVTSDESRRDGQFRGRIMAVDQFPNATFVLTAPVEVGDTPPDGEIVTFTVTGDLTLRGTTKPVTVDLQAFVSGGRITVTGEIPIVFAEWGIPEPSFGPATVEDNGLIEFLLTFEPTT